MMKDKPVFGRPFAKNHRRASVRFAMGSLLAFWVFTISSEATWTSSGSGSVVFTEQGAQVTFAASDFLPPKNCTLEKQLQSPVGALIGLRIHSESGCPMSAIVTVKSETKECFCYVTDEMPGSGGTKTILLNNASETWMGQADALNNPQTVSVYIRQGSTQKEIYLIEDLFLAEKPLGTSTLLSSTPERIGFSWQGLHSNLCYEVLKTTDLKNGIWEQHAVLNHPASTIYSIETGGEECGFYRLRVKGDE
ncbi:MAG: hypothetical protein PHG65_01305 [Kiritimatiellae bacterium]|nr:hypothetical protein [Kiritimatiellia bacterium]